MSDQGLTPGQLFEALAREMATAVAALVGETTEIVAAVSAPATAWTASLAASGALAGTVSIGLSEEHGRRVSALIMGFDGDDVADEAVLDTLREICGQAIGSLGHAPETSVVRLSVENVARGTLSSGGVRAWQFTLPGGATAVIAIGGELSNQPAAVEAVPVAAPTPAATPRSPGKSANGTGTNLDLLLDLELPVSVRFGHTELTLQTLTRLGPGSVIDLHRSADEPVEVLVSGKVIARGEVVVVEGNYGVRVTEVVSTAERIRSLGA